MLPEVEEAVLEPLEPEEDAVLAEDPFVTVVPLTAAVPLAYRVKLAQAMRVLFAKWTTMLRLPTKEPVPGMVET